MAQHARMQEILIDGGEFVFQDRVQVSQNGRIAAHRRPPPQLSRAYVGAWRRAAARLARSQPAAGNGSGYGKSTTWRSISRTRGNALAAFRLGAERAIDHRDSVAITLGLGADVTIADPVADTHVHPRLCLESLPNLAKLRLIRNNLGRMAPCASGAQGFGNRLLQLVDQFCPAIEDRQDLVPAFRRQADIDPRPRQDRGSA